MLVHAAPRALLAELDAASIPYEVIPHRHAETALDEADAVSIDPFDVAKTIVLATHDGFVRAVLPASARLDMHKVRELLETNHVELVTEEVLAGAYPEFELGAVPPFGGPSGDRVLVDGHLDRNLFVVVAAGTHDESVRLMTTDLIALTDALLGDLCAERPSAVAKTGPGYNAASPPT